jgi:PAS domain-containing protein
MTKESKPMAEVFLEENGFLRSVFDAVPAMMLVVDADVSICFWNAAASKLVGTDKKLIYKKRGGEVLGCIHAADDSGGCGRGAHCKDCVIRNAVNEAVRGGTVHRQKTRMELHNNGAVVEAHMLATAASFIFEEMSFVLLTLEDISELMQLQSMLPICAGCKKIRDDKQYWESVDMYFNKHLDVEFTHSLCPECIKKLYPDSIAGT